MLSDFSTINLINNSQFQAYSNVDLPNHFTDRVREFSNVKLKTGSKNIKILVSEERRALK